MKFDCDASNSTLPKSLMVLIVWLCIVWWSLATCSSCYNLTECINYVTLEGIPINLIYSPNLPFRKLHLPKHEVCFLHGGEKSQFACPEPLAIVVFRHVLQIGLNGVLLRTYVSWSYEEIIALFSPVSNSHTNKNISLPSSHLSNQGGHPMKNKSNTGF